VFCIYNIIAILDGLIYFQQGSRLSALHAGLVALGTVILLLGVLALSWRLDDTTPEEAANQAVPPRTPLTPGMGLVQSPSNERDPLLPNGRKRSSTSLSRGSINEQTPLLVGRARPSRISVQPAPDTDTEGIWAELDDEARQADYLASLPRAPSPFLTHNIKSRRRGNSGSSQALSSGSRPSSSASKAGSTDRPEALIGKDAVGVHRRRSSAPQVPSPAPLQSRQHTRDRSTSVRFAKSESRTRDNDQRPGSRRASRSRFDQGASEGGED